MFFAVSKPITCLSLQCFFLGPLCDGYRQERGGRQNFPSLCRCCGQITICSTWSFVTSKWPALDSIKSASLSPDFDRWQISSWVVILSWYSSTFTIWDKPRDLPHLIFLISLKLHDSKFMLKCSICACQLRLQRTIRSESTQDKAKTLPPASRDYVMLFAIFLKRLKLFFASSEFQKWWSSFVI